MQKQREDLSGQTFGKLLVLNFIEMRSNYVGVYLCQCECGKHTKVMDAKLRSGWTKSCGCLRTEFNRGERTTHGMRNTPEYHSYNGAKGRCTNPKNGKYFDYGGRGIEFRFNSFEEFYKEVGPKPKGTSLDRCNNEGHYELGNVRWSTFKEQSANRREFSKDRVNQELLVAYAKAVMGEY